MLLLADLVQPRRGWSGEVSTSPANAMSLGWEGMGACRLLHTGQEGQ